MQHFLTKSEDLVQSKHKHKHMQKIKERQENDLRTYLNCEHGYDVKEKEEQKN